MLSLGTERASDDIAAVKSTRLAPQAHPGNRGFSDQGRDPGPGVNVTGHVRAALPPACEAGFLVNAAMMRRLPQSGSHSLDFDTPHVFCRVTKAVFEH